MDLGCSYTGFWWVEITRNATIDIAFKPEKPQHCQKKKCAKTTVETCPFTVQLLSKLRSWTLCSVVLELSKWNFDVERVAETQCSVHRFNVEAAHFGARVLKRRSPGEGAMSNRIEIWHFRGQMLMKLDEIFMEQSGPKGRHFPVGFISQALRRYEQACKNPVSGPRGCRVRWRNLCTEHCVLVSQLHVPHQNSTSTCFSTA